MKQSDPLELVDEGTLNPPGPVGRLVRFAFGALCLYALYQLFLHNQSIIQKPISVLPNIGVLVLIALLIFNYVVNIGFGKSWGRWPNYLSIAVLLILAGAAWLVFETPDHPLLGIALWTWLVYFCAHLGLSFVLAATIATPGCEMRAIPHLIGKITGRAADEHHCPGALIASIDAWESKRS